MDGMRAQRGLQGEVWVSGMGQELKRGLDEGMEERTEVLLEEVSAEGALGTGVSIGENALFCDGVKMSNKLEAAEGQMVSRD